KHHCDHGKFTTSFYRSDFGVAFDNHCSGFPRERFKPCLRGRRLCLLRKGGRSRQEHCDSNSPEQIHRTISPRRLILEQPARENKCADASVQSWKREHCGASPSKFVRGLSCPN